jgi:urease accessory protein
MQMIRPHLILIVAAVLFAAGPAAAHTEAGVPGGLLSGFLHPLSGWDHLVAMVAVGLWGAQLGKPGIWVLPVCFPAVMAVGGVLGVVGVSLPATELVIALSALVLGLVVAMALRLPFWAAAVVVGVFAAFHGYAHGREMPGASNALAYGVGFVCATGMLHAAGILFGTLTRWPAGAWAVRAVGVAIAGLGGIFLLSMPG